MYAIAAAALDWAIGKGGDQLCYIPADLKRFKALTTGHAVILGRRTLATFPGGRPLPGRRNLVLSRDPAWTLVDRQGPLRHQDISFCYDTYLRRAPR